MEAAVVLPHCLQAFLLWRGLGQHLILQLPTGGLSLSAGRGTRSESPVFIRTTSAFRNATFWRRRSLPFVVPFHRTEPGRRLQQRVPFSPELAHPGGSTALSPHGGARPTPLRRPQPSRRVRGRLARKEVTAAVGPSGGAARPRFEHRRQRGQHEGGGPAVLLGVLHTDFFRKRFWKVLRADIRLKEGKTRALLVQS